MKTPVVLATLIALLGAPALAVPASAVPARATLPPSDAVRPPATPAARTMAEVRTTGQARAVAAIKAAWPDHLEANALRLAWRESGWTPQAISRSGDYGLLQLNWRANRAWLKTFGITTPQQLLNPEANAMLSYELYKMAGWKPWRLPTGR